MTLLVAIVIGEDQCYITTVQHYKYLDTGLYLMGIPPKSMKMSKIPVTHDYIYVAQKNIMHYSTVVWAEWGRVAWGLGEGHMWRGE